MIRIQNYWIEMSKEHTNKQSEEKHGEDTKKTKDDGDDEADMETMIHDEEHYFSNYYMALGALACILPGGFIIAWLIHSWN